MGSEFLVDVLEKTFLMLLVRPTIFDFEDHTFEFVSQVNWRRAFRIWQQELTNASTNPLDKL